MELEEHIGYLTDRRRTELYRAAIASAIRPGDVVVDLGCGSGVLGLLCLQAGAGFVYGIDRGNIVVAARESFGRAGFGAQAEILQGDTRQINLPRMADVLISDHVGYFGFDYGVIGLLRDARRRFLSMESISSFKPKPCRGFVESCWRAGNAGSHPSRSARLNSGVRPQSPTA